MKLKVWDLSKEEKKQLILAVEAKIVGINEWNHLFYTDKNEEFHMVCKIRNGIDVFEIEE